MTVLLLLTSALQPTAEVLPALSLLRAPGQDPARRGQRAARGARLPTCCSSTAAATSPHARDLCRLIRTTGTDVPRPARRHRGRPRRSSPPTGAWTTCVLHTAGPAELEARIRLAIGRLARSATPTTPSRT